MDIPVETTGPRCKLCGYALKAESGCVTCTEVKKFIIWPVLSHDENEIETAQKLTQFTAKLIKKQLVKLSCVQSKTVDYLPDLDRSLTSLSRALKELSGEIRKLEDRAASEYNNLGFEAQCRLYLEHWFLKLPQEYQTRLLSEMNFALDEQSKPLEIS